MEVFFLGSNTANAVKDSCGKCVTTSDGRAELTTLHRLRDAFNPDDSLHVPLLVLPERDGTCVGHPLQLLDILHWGTRGIGAAVLNKILTDVVNSGNADTIRNVQFMMQILLRMKDWCFKLQLCEDKVRTFVNWVNPSYMELRPLVGRLRIDICYPAEYAKHLVLKNDGQEELAKQSKYSQILLATDAVAALSFMMESDPHGSPKEIANWVTPEVFHACAQKMGVTQKITNNYGGLTPKQHSVIEHVYEERKRFPDTGTNVASTQANENANRMKKSINIGFNASYGEDVRPAQHVLIQLESGMKAKQTGRRLLKKELAPGPAKPRAKPENDYDNCDNLPDDWAIALFRTMAPVVEDGKTPVILKGKERSLVTPIPRSLPADQNLADRTLQKEALRSKSKEASSAFDVDSDEEGPDTRDKLTAQAREKRAAKEPAAVGPPLKKKKGLPSNKVPVASAAPTIQHIDDFMNDSEEDIDELVKEIGTPNYTTVQFNMINNKGVMEAINYSKEKLVFHKTDNPYTDKDFPVVRIFKPVVQKTKLYPS